MRARLLVVLPASLLFALASACSGTSSAPDPDESPVDRSIPPALRLPTDQPLKEARRVLSLVPASATVLTITDYDGTRTRPEVMLTGGVLREDMSVLAPERGVTQDDVDWEAHFSGPEGSGYVVSFRPGLDMSLVRGALRKKARATVLDGQHLLVQGVAEDDEPVWAMDPAFAQLTEAGAESTYFRRGCVPVRDALGVEATPADQEALVSRADPTYLRPLEAFSVSFGDRVATARLGVDRTDLHERAHLVGLWPNTGEPDVDDGFAGLAVADASTGRIGLRVVDPAAAAALTLDEMLPFAVCNEVLPFEDGDP